MKENLMCTIPVTTHCTALETLLSVHLGLSERQKPLQILILWAAVSVSGAILSDSAMKIRNTNAQF